MPALKHVVGTTAGLFALWTAAPAAAHHSFAMFDHTKNVTLQGVVQEFDWKNPHIFIQLLAPKSAGATPVSWNLEGPSVNILVRNGWYVGIVKPGDKITVTMNPLKSGVSGGSLNSVTISGKTFFVH